MKKIIYLLGIFIVTFIFNTNVLAASTSLSVSSNSVYVGDSFTVSANVNAAAAWNIHVSAVGPVNGCSINQADASSDALDINKSFTATCTTTGEGTITITLSGDVTSATDGNAVNISDSKSVTVSNKSEPVPVPEPVPEPEPIQEANSIPNQPSTSEPSNSKVKEVILSNDASLKNIILSKGKIIFNKDTEVYDINVSSDVDKVNVDGEVNQSAATVKLEGDTTLKKGLNVIKIKVTAEDGKTTKTYTLNITRTEKELSNNSKAKNIEVKNYNLDFKENKNDYTLEIGKEKKLLINVKLYDKLATYEIKDNNKLENGSIIKIVVTAEDGTKTNYTIKIEKKKINPFIIFFRIIGIIVICLMTFALSYFFRKKSKNKKENLNNFNNKTDELLIEENITEQEYNKLYDNNIKEDNISNYEPKIQSLNLNLNENNKNDSETDPFASTNKQENNSVNNNNNNQEDYQK